MVNSQEYRLSMKSKIGIFLGFVLLLYTFLIAYANINHSANTDSYLMGVFGGLITGAACVFRLIRRQRLAVWFLRAAVCVFIANILLRKPTGDSFHLVWLAIAAVCLLASWLVAGPDEPIAKIMARRQAELQASKRMTSALVVSLTYAIVFLIVTILWVTFPTNDYLYGLFLVHFTLEMILFTVAAVFIAKRRITVGIRLLIVGGVLSLPLGIIAIVFAMIARTKLKRALLGTEGGSRALLEDD